MDHIWSASYPTDPGPAIQEVLDFAKGPVHDYKKLVHASYELIGYGLHVAFDENQAATLASGINAALAVMQGSVTGLPSWVLPLAMNALQALLQILLKQKS